MLSPICDGTRLIFGIITTLGGIVFASMTSALKNDIKTLYHRLFRRAKDKTTAAKPVTNNQRTSKFLGWLLLAISFSTTVFLGSYVAAVPSKTCEKIIISELVCNPPGDDLEGEFATVQNLSRKKINLNKWTLCDYQSSHCYLFKAVTIQPNSSIKIWTKAGTDTSTDLYFGEPQPVWNNETDTAYLYDIKSQLIYQLPCPKTAAEPALILPAEYDDLECIPRDANREAGQVVDVIDGRTIDVERNDGSMVRVRYLGIATIVKGQPLYEQSVEINKKLVLGKTVTLVEDPEGTQMDEMLLRYVFVGDSFINFDLVSSGYAVPDDYCSCTEIFLNTNMGAFESDRGFAGSNVEMYGNPFFDTPPEGFFDDSPSMKNKVAIVDIFYDGNKGAQEPDEYVEIRNDGTEAIQLKDWTLSDNSGHTFVFPEFTLELGKSCRIYTNEYHSDWCGFNFESPQAIWGNSEDCATLRDEKGLLVEQACYK